MRRGRRSGAVRRGRRRGGGVRAVRRPGGAVLMRTSRPVRLEPISTKISTTCLISFRSICSPSRSFRTISSTAARTSRLTALKTISWKFWAGVGGGGEKRDAEVEVEAEAEGEVVEVVEAEGRHRHLVADLLELGEREALDVEAVEVLEDVREEADHQRVVLPPPHLRGRRGGAGRQRGVGRAWSGGDWDASGKRGAHQLLQHRLVVLLLDVREDARREVVLDRLAVVLVQVLRPVVRRLLRAHRVHRRVQRRVLVGRDLLRVLAVAEVLEDLLDLEDAALPQLLPPLLQRDHRLRHRHALCAGSCLRTEGRGRG